MRCVDFSFQHQLAFFPEQTMPRSNTHSPSAIGCYLCLLLVLSSCIILGCRSTRPGLSTDLTPPPWATAPNLKRILIVPLTFPGRAPYGDRENIEQRWGVDLRNYIREMSYGKVQVDFEVTPWIQMPKPITEYRLSSWRIRKWTVKDHYRRIFILEDAGALLDNMYDLSSYDGLMLVLGCRWKAFGRYGYLCRSLSGFFDVRTPSGNLIPPTDVHTYDVPFPSIAYALPKMLGGYKDGRSVVPTLYDFKAQATPGPYGYANKRVHHNKSHQYFSIYAGPWDIQSQHGIPTSRGYMAQGLSSFSRLRLGWIDSKQVCIVEEGQSRTVLLGPLWDGNAETLVIRLPLNNECCYYLIENRQGRGVDKHLPSEGVLVLKVDETIRESEGPVRIIDAHPLFPFFRRAPFNEGEEFLDQVNGITVRVITEEGNDYRVEIRRSTL